MTPIPTAHLLKERGEELCRVNNRRTNGIKKITSYQHTEITVNVKGSSENLFDALRIWEAAPERPVRSL
jgi:hypothetical protein